MDVERDGMPIGGPSRLFVGGPWPGMNSGALGRRDCGGGGGREVESAMLCVVFVC